MSKPNTYKKNGPSPMGPVVVGEKPADFKGSMAKLIKFCKPWYAAILTAFCFSIIGSILIIIAPNRLAEVTDLITAGLFASIDMNAVIKKIMGMLILYGSSAILIFGMGWTMTTVMQKLSWSLRKSILEKINRLPLRYFDRSSVGDILSRVTNDVDTIGQTLSQSITSLVSGSTQFIGCIIMMFITNWIMALTAIGSSLIGFIMMFVIISNSQKHFKTQQDNLGAIDGHIEEIYSGHDIVRVYGGGMKAKEIFGEINDKLYVSGWKSQFFSGLMPAIMGFLGNFCYVAVCVVGAVLAMNGTITFGIIVSFMIYIRLFTMPMAQIAQAATKLQSAGAAGERIFAFIGEEEVPNDDDIPKALETVTGNVRFDHVRFGYNEDKAVINDFSVSVKAGQKIAIVGHTGAGKTTLVNLLMRFYDVWSGEISIDGVPTSAMKRSEVRGMFGMVLQDTWLFEGTYRENIAYGKANVSDTEIEDACKAVGLDHFIRTLPKGYNTVLSDRSSLSEGQRQLLTIARAMVENAPMIILDEATSSVDTRTEILVQQAMDKLTHGRTSFIIAHRLSTIRNADMILVMHDGDVIESGAHEDLLALGGHYAELYNSQFENS